MKKLFKYTVFFFVLLILMATSSGPNDGSTFVDDATVGTKTWSNPGNAQFSDDIYATVSLVGEDISHYLKATNFGFSIPDGSTINGIAIDVERKRNIAGGSLTSDQSVRIVKGGVITGSDLTNGLSLPTTDTYITYGGSSNLWGTTWTVAQINASDFGFVWSGIGEEFETATVSIDHIRITVYYTEAGGTHTMMYSTI